VLLPAGPAEGERWDLAALPSLLASISTSSSNHLTAAALAPDASAVAAADRQKLRLFRLQQQQAGEQQQQVTVSKVKLEQQLDCPVVCCTFSADSSLLFAATGSGKVVAVDAATGEVVASQQLAAAAGSSGSGAKKPAGQKQQQQQQSWCSCLAWAMPRVSVMAASADGQLLAVATASGVELLSAAAGDSLLQPLRQLSLLGEPSAITAVQFNPASKIVAVATAANSFAAYDVDTGLPTQWSLKHQEEAEELMNKLPGSIAGLSFKPCAGQQDGSASVLAYSAGGLCHIDMDQPLLPQQDGVVQAGSNSKQRRKLRHQQGPGASRVDAASQNGRNGRLLKLEDSCLLVGHCSRSEVVLLEKPWQEVLQALLPPVYRHRYGT
jgi:U3 small nucleolar RNA-associated protein 4